MDYFSNYTIHKFYNLYNINLDEIEYLNMENIIIPNFYKNKPFFLTDREYDYESREFLRIINKIFGFNYSENNFSLYETQDFNIKSDDIVFDCGANLGIFSIYASYKGKQVYAFEPGSFIRQYTSISKTYAYNSNIELLPYALSNHTGTMTFSQYDNPAASRLEEGTEAPLAHDLIYKENVKAITLDKFVEQTKIIPNFIKVDIEGSELNMLEGAWDTIYKYNPTISLSLHDNNVSYIQDVIKKFPDNYSFEIKNEMFYDTVLIGGIK